MDLFRKQEAAERQLMEWKQVPERLKLGGHWMALDGFWYMFLSEESRPLAGFDWRVCR